jgi:uncharacterized protein
MTAEADFEATNKELVRKSFVAWGHGTGSPYDLLADDAVWTIVGQSAASRTYHGREDFLANVIRPFGSRMASHFIPTIHELYADGDAVVILFDAEGTARDGVAYKNTYAWFLKFAGEKIVKATAFYDSVLFNELWKRVSPQA